MATARKPLSANTYAWSVDVSAAYEASSVAKASAGTLRSVHGYNSGPTQWIQIGNNSSLPADATVPRHTIYVGTQQNFSIDFGEDGEYFSTGITVWNSTTGPTKTIGAADCWFNVRYI